jgi:hypothetical protein
MRRRSNIRIINSKRPTHNRNLIFKWVDCWKQNSCENPICKPYTSSGNLIDFGLSNSSGRYILGKKTYMAQTLEFANLKPLAKT